MASAGLEVLYESLSQQINCPEDAVICVIHWGIVQSGFKCVGVGENGPHGKETELLPRGWNTSRDQYILRYHQTSSNDDFVLKVVRIDNSLLVHFMRCKDEKVSSMNIRVSNYTTADQSEFDKAYKNLEELERRILSDVVNVFTSSSQKSSTQASESRTHRTQARYRLEDDNDPLRVPGTGNRPHREWMPSNDPFAVGRGDLDPLAGGMGGMLMDPRRSGGHGLGPDPNAGLPGRLPPGSIPPGARFDPFGPAGSRPGPDPDHEKPPDYDDMFM